MRGISRIQRNLLIELLERLSQWRGVVVLNVDTPDVISDQISIFYDTTRYMVHVAAKSLSVNG